MDYGGATRRGRRKFFILLILPINVGSVCTRTPRSVGVVIGPLAAISQNSCGTADPHFLFQIYRPHAREKKKQTALKYTERSDETGGAFFDHDFTFLFLSGIHFGWRFLFVCVSALLASSRRIGVIFTANRWILFWVLLPLQENPMAKKALAPCKIFRSGSGETHKLPWLDPIQTG